MAVIGVYSVKGGVGKTTISVDLAWRSAAMSGHRTLLWDLDPQGGAGFLLGHDDRQVHRAVSVFQRDGRPRDLIVPTPYDQLSLLQSDESMRSLTVALARIGHRRRLSNLTALLSHEYQRIILDCPPVLNEISDQILSAADLLIVPLPASPLASRALATIRKELLRNHQRHPPILPVLSMYDGRRRLHREVRGGAASAWPIVPMASAVEQTAVRRMPIGAFANWSDASRSLQRVWDEVECKLAEIAASRETQPAA
jgi:cellulose biosynthesis protein BcsQ